MHKVLLFFKSTTRLTHVAMYQSENTRLWVVDLIDTQWSWNGGDSGFYVSGKTILGGRHGLIATCS